MDKNEIAEDIRQAHQYFLNKLLERKDLFNTADGILFKLEFSSKKQAPQSTGVCYEFKSIVEVTSVFEELMVKNYESKLLNLWEENQRFEPRHFLIFRLKRNPF